MLPNDVSQIVVNCDTLIIQEIVDGMEQVDRGILLPINGIDNSED